MYVLFEGIDGVGKSTQIELMSLKFKDALVTKEPGGTKFGEFVRKILLENKFNLDKNAEMFLFLADRSEHHKSVIRSNKNRLILSDRGFISGMAYALANDENSDKELLLAFNKFALRNELPNKIVLFLADKELLEKRLKGRNYNDIIEKRGTEYLFKVQENMLNLVDELGIENLKINANLKIEEISKKIEQFIRG